MNKKFLFGLLASVAMVGCSDNNGLDDKENGLDGQKGTDTYLTVNIMDASSLTRATGGDPDSLMTGTAEEHLVTSADFYFYDENGIYVSKANVWRGGNPNKPENTPTDTTGNHNVEFFGNSVVVLKGLKETTFPTYMVTILNAPAKFEPGATLDEMEKTLSYASASDASYLNDGKFIMSTTSYKHGGDEALPYFVTKVNTSDFQLEPVADPFNAIDVYVERLAAKVILKVDDSNDSKLKPVEDKKNVYEIEWTVAGKDNEDEAGSNDIGIGAETLYVTFLGWDLNATAKYSYMMKNIDETWTNGYLGFAWNIADLYRSYWGKSVNYGESGYPESANDLKTIEEGNVVDTPNEYLNYVSFGNLMRDMGTAAYCAENTNKVEVLKDAFGSAVTSILLKAKISTDKEGKETPDLVSYQGMLFKEADYLAYVLSRVQNVDGVNVWYKVSSDPDVYRQWDVDFVELQNIGDAKTKVQLKEPLPAGKDDLYRRDVEFNEAAGKNDTTWTALTDIEGINKTLGDFNTTTGFDAIAYKGGLMYYNIPIEHLNDNNEYRTTRKIEDLKEANYGIVRNHLYEVTINSLKNPGHGVFDPTEVIVPSTKDEDNSLYYVGAKINILSWKIVKQNVGL